MATLEKKALRDATREELRRKQVELNEARTLQLALAPPAFRGSVGGQSVAIDVVLEPAREVGGDLVDYFRIGADLLVLLIGDVSDKGAGAALMTARPRALFRSLPARPAAAGLFGQPEDAIAIVNAALAAGNATCMFVTLLLGVYNGASHQFRYVRAGHVPPFLRRIDGTVRRLGEPGGVPLDLLDNAIHMTASFELAPGDELLIVTDGITEAPDPAQNLFGDARVTDLLADTGPEPFTSLPLLISKVRGFEAGLPPSDDIAALLMKIGVD